jgi:hypothetical protein
LREIPTYVDFPLGLTSPESDGDREGRNAKRRPAAVEGKEGIEALRKAVCLDCYYLAFKRHYPGAVCAEFSRAIRHMEIVQDPVPEVSYMPDPTLEVHR